MITLNYRVWKGKTGIYGIRHSPSNRIYVGQTVDIGGRWSVHLATLRLNKHHCRYLQNVWNKYTESEFKFIGLHICTISELDYWEFQYCKKFKGLTLNTYPPGRCHRGYAHSVETRERMSLSAQQIANSDRGREQRRQQALNQHREGKAKYREVKNIDKICICCGTEFKRYKLNYGYHSGKKCLICMAATFASQGGRFNLDQFQVDQKLWDMAAYELTWKRLYVPSE